MSTPNLDSSSLPNLDDAAAELQAKADEVLSTDTDAEAAIAGGKREAIRKAAYIVKEQAGKGLETSKDYLSKVVNRVSNYAADASATASTQLTGVKEKGLTQFSAAKEKGITQLTAAKESANIHLATAKESANTQLAGFHTDLNKAIAQGQGTTDREIPDDAEPLKFPFNFIAWVVSICSKGGSTTTSTAPSTSTSKDFSVESLQNAAATLTEKFTQEAQSVREKAIETAGEEVETSKSAGLAAINSAKEGLSGATGSD